MRWLLPILAAGALRAAPNSGPADFDKARKLEILKLREGYRMLRGGQFQVLEFHDRFLAQGYPPVKIIRRAMLGNDSPVL
jgi:hypothetical protein